MPTSEADNVIELSQTILLNDQELSTIHMAVETNENNLPVPENIPTGGYTNTYATGDNWGHDGICPCQPCLISAANNQPGLQNVQGWPSLVKLFEVSLCPIDFVK